MQLRNGKILVSCILQIQQVQQVQQLPKTLTNQKDII